MIALLDHKTLIFYSIACNLALLSVLVHTWRTRRSYPGFTTWIAATGSYVAGSAINLTMIARGVAAGGSPPVMAVLCGQFLLLLHLALLYEGIVEYCLLPRRRLRSTLTLLLLAAFVACGAYTALASDSISARIIVSSLFFALFDLRIALEPLVGAGRRYKTTPLLCGIFITLAILFLHRAYILASSPPFIRYYDLLQHESHTKIAMIVGMVSMIIITYCFIAMTSERVEQELREARQRELELNERQRRFFDLVTHEFKTPLAIIDRAAQFISHRLNGREPELQERLTAIRAGSGRLRATVVAYTDIPVLTRGELHPDGAPVTLKEITLKVLAESRQLHPERTLKLTPGPELLPLRCDPRLIAHLMGIIIDNAVKFSTPEKPVELAITLEGEHQTFRVSDRGIGIPPGELSTVATRPFRAANASEFPGSGIGLHTARYIAHHHGGDLILENRNGGGLTVTLLLPC